MAACSRVLLLTAIASLLIILSSRSLEARDIALYRGQNRPEFTTYWGQNGRFNEGSLRDLCYTGSFDYVIISSLSTFGNGQEPILDLSDHCNPQSYQGCIFLSSQIRACQRRGVKVLLSIGGAVIGDRPSYTLHSSDEATYIADYLWHNFLGGRSHWRPLGDAILDGIDFDIEGGSYLYWDDLARSLSLFNSPYRTVELSAAPSCTIPDKYLDSAITAGLFNHVWVKFFDSPSCQYTTNADNLLESWSKWEAYIPGVSKLFLGLPASPLAARTGYVDSQTLINEILPGIQSNPKYGGIMLWSRYFDPYKSRKGSSSEANTTSFM